MYDFKDIHVQCIVQCTMYNVQCTMYNVHVCIITFVLIYTMSVLYTDMYQSTTIDHTLIILEPAKHKMSPTIAIVSLITTSEMLKV